MRGNCYLFKFFSWKWSYFSIHILYNSRKVAFTLLHEWKLCSCATWLILNCIQKFPKDTTHWKYKVKVLVAQYCLTLCDPMDCSLPGSSLHEILQARILEWVAIPFSRGLPNPGIKRGFPALRADSLSSKPPG